MNFLSGLLGTVGTNLASGLLDKGLKLGKELLSGGKQGMISKLEKKRDHLVLDRIKSQVKQIEQILDEEINNIDNMQIE